MTAILTTCVNPVWLEHSSYAAPGALRPANFDPDLQWNMEMINAPGAWGIMQSLATNGTTLHPVVVAVLDTGIEADHPSLSGQLLTDYAANFYDGAAAEVDLDGHGTHVAGIIGADSSGSEVFGAAIDHASIISVRVVPGGNESSPTSTVVNGIDYVVAVKTGEANGGPLPVKVMNLSLGGGHDPAMYEAIGRAVAAGIAVVAAAGNIIGPYTEGLVAPAVYDNTIAVGATTGTGDRTYFSMFGSGLDFVAPGQQIESTVPPNNYGTMSGTSMATPHVAGVAALLYALEPGLNQDAVYSILRATALDLGTPGWDKYYGHGLVDAQAALEYLLNLQQRIPRAPMGADDPGGTGGISIQTAALSGAQYPEADSDIDSHSVILRFHDGEAPVTDPELANFEARLRQQFGIASARRVGAHIMVVKLGAGQQPLEMLQPLAALDEVQYSQPNYRYQAIR